MTIDCAAGLGLRSPPDKAPRSRRPPGDGLRAGCPAGRQRRGALLFVLFGVVIGVAALQAGSGDLATNRPLRDLPDEALVGLLAGVVVGIRVLSQAYARRQ